MLKKETERHQVTERWSLWPDFSQPHTEEKVELRFELEFLRCLSIHSYPVLPADWQLCSAPQSLSPGFVSDWVLPWWPTLILKLLIFLSTHRPESPHTSAPNCPSWCPTHLPAGSTTTSCWTSLIPYTYLDFYLIYHLFIHSTDIQYVSLYHLIWEALECCSTELAPRCSGPARGKDR